MIVCSTHEEWRHRITSSILKTLSTAIKLRGKASFLVSGGSTPRSIYEKLSGEEGLDWNRVHLALVDERWVDPDHQASNEKLIRETLLQGKPSASLFTEMKSDHATPHLAADSINEAYQKLPFPFDVVLLGMGSDGHTASLFPFSTGLENAINTVDIVAPITARKSSVTGNHLNRMTLTGPAIATAQSVILALKGEGKKIAYDQALNCEDIHAMPVSIFLGADNLVTYWTES